MTREIPKFKAWDGTLFYEPIIACGKLYRDWRDFEDENNAPYDELIRPTGIKDRNGKGREIYEGDVYKQDNRHYVVEWSEYNVGFVARSLASKHVLPGFLRGEIAVYDDFEHIGSIYEHPHLLEESK